MNQYSSVLLLVLLLLTLTTGSLAADPGDLDITFGSGGKVYNLPTNFMPAEDVAIQADGKIVLAGSTLGPDNTQDFAVVRLNANGSPDMTFGVNGMIGIPFDSGFNEMGIAVALQSDGRIIVAGNVQLGTSGWDFGVVRLHPGGGVDTTYSGGKVKLGIDVMNGGDDFVFDMIIQPDDKVVITGTTRPTPNKDIGIVRLTTTGTVDVVGMNPFRVRIDTATEDEGLALARDASGNILIAGSIGGDFCVLRFTPAGGLDMTFNGSGFVVTPIGSQLDRATSIGIQSDGKIVAAGTANSGSFDEIAFARYTNSGQLDNTFDGDGRVTYDVRPMNSDGLSSVLIQADGKIIGVGTSGGAYILVRLNTDGSLDPTFGTGGKVIANVAPTVGGAHRAVLQPDGKIVAVGDGSGPGTFGFTAARFLTVATPIFRPPYDFDGDGKTDISIFRPTGAEWWISRSGNGQPFAAQFGVSSDRIVPGDYTGDGKDDIAVWRPASGEWFILRSEDFSYYSFPFGISSDLPAPADYDADNKVDAAVFRPSTGVWYISNSGGGTTIVQFGTNGDVPVQADYDGDGRADMAIFRGSNGSWWLRQSTAGTISFVFGSGFNDRPLPGGDFTGDGKADVAITRGGTQWYVARSELPSSYYSFNFGVTGDIPAIGDFDGDGRTDPAMFRPSNGTWYIDRSTAGPLIQHFGTTGDRPVPNAYVP